MHNHRGRVSTAIAGRATGVGRSKAAADIYEHETTNKVIAEYKNRYKKILKFVKDGTEANDPSLTPDDPSVASRKLSDMKWENIVHFLSTRTKQRNPGKGDP